MSQEDRSQDRLSDDDAAFDVLADLERQTPDTIRRQRSTVRLTVKARVVIQPANSSDAFRLKIQAVTGDVSAGGCRIMAPVPLCVGDVFRLRFDESELDLPLVFARCMRCRLIREDAFEVGFQFFSPVRLPEAPSAERKDLLSVPSDPAP